MPQTPQPTHLRAEIAWSSAFTGRRDASTGGKQIKVYTSNEPCRETETSAHVQLPRPDLAPRCALSFEHSFYPRGDRRARSVLIQPTRENTQSIPSKDECPRTYLLSHTKLSTASQPQPLDTLAPCTALERNLRDLPHGSRLYAASYLHTSTATSPTT